MLAPLLGSTPPDRAVLVGPETADDAGVYRFGASALVATADFITPMCDEPRRFGRIAAANALSDVYAMGGNVLFALNLCCFPEGDVPQGVFGEILQGGLDKITEAGAALLGGHSVRDAELKFGLAVVGTVDPHRILTNAAARPGQALVLTKPLGTGAIINGFRSAKIDAAGMEPALASMERLNAEAAGLALTHGAGACTDVTGYGLAGHGLEMARASGVGLRLHAGTLPVLDAFATMVNLGVRTRGTRENESAFGDEMNDRAGLQGPGREILFDPQTSGPLLVALPADAAADFVEGLRESGHQAARIGEVVTGPARIEVVTV